MLKLKNEFPLIHGLQDTIKLGSYNLDANRKYIISENNMPRMTPLPQNGIFVQIMHSITREHWFVISGNCDQSERICIDVYDSFNDHVLNNELISQVSSMFRCHKIESQEKSLVFNFYTVTAQRDSSSCGLHALVNAIILCNDGYPDCHILKTENNYMRQHLITIIQN